MMIFFFFFYPCAASLHISISCQKIMCVGSCQMQPLHTPWSHVILLSVPALSASFPPRHAKAIFPGWIKALLCYVVYLAANYTPVNQHNMAWISGIVARSQISVWKQPLILTCINVWFISCHTGERYLPAHSLFLSWAVNCLTDWWQGKD